MKRFHCSRCGHEVYFNSDRCVGCQSWLGFSRAHMDMLSAGPDYDGDADGTAALWVHDDGTYSACTNRALSQCNWLVPGETSALCTACRHNQVVPNPSDPDVRWAWTRLERAKRQLVYSLIRWNLPRPTKDEDPDDGLAFAFLADTVDEQGNITRVMTGHAAGLITLSVEEGDDAEREARRTDLGEPFRTLIGHFRHEVGHYYWDRLVADADENTQARVRAVFGDERSDYSAALQQHYANGPQPGWQNFFISSYAAAHPWEDFAETFAHYAHMVDGLETAVAFEISAHAPIGTDPYISGTAQELLDAWVPMTLVVNALNRSMGQPDLYPFVIPNAVAEKLGVIHDLVRDATRRG